MKSRRVILEWGITTMAGGCSVSMTAMMRICPCCVTSSMATISMTL